MRENKKLLWDTERGPLLQLGVFTIEETTLPVNIADSPRSSEPGGTARLYWMRPPGCRYMTSTYLFARMENVRSEVSFLPAGVVLPCTVHVIAQ